MATTFQARVEKYFTNACGAAYMPSTTQLSDILTSGAATVINRVPKGLLGGMTLEATVSDGTGYSIASSKIDNVQRYYKTNTTYYPCRSVTSSNRRYLTDYNSMQYAPYNDPAFYILANKIYIQPDPTTDHKGYVYYIVYPTVVYTDTEATAAVATWPMGMIDLVVTYSVGQIKLREIDYYKDIISDAKAVIEALVTADDTEVAQTEIVALQGYTTALNSSVADFAAIEQKFEKDLQGFIQGLST